MQSKCKKSIRETTNAIKTMQSSVIDYEELALLKVADESRRKGNTIFDLIDHGYIDTTSLEVFVRK